MIKKDITWLAEGTLKGNPSVMAGCETVCGNKQNWKLGITPIISKKRTTIKTNLYAHNFIVSLSVEDTQGGTCTSSWKTSTDTGKHRIEVTIKIYGKTGIISENTHVIVGGGSALIPIVEYGRYNFHFKALEWGEECNKPTNTSTKNITISPLDGTDDNGNGGGGGDDGDNDSIGLIDTYKYPLAMLIGAGVIVAISAFMDKGSK